jgi:hypothetical protein
MVVMRIAMLCGLGAALGGCLSAERTVLPGTALSYAEPPARLALDDASPPVVEPGQPLRSDLGRTGAGVDPITDLSASERARTAWKAQHPSELALPSWPSAHSANTTRVSRVSDPTSTASVPARSKGTTQRGVRTQPRDAEAAMDDLERSGQRAAKPICSGC